MVKHEQDRTGVAFSHACWLVYFLCGQKIHAERTELMRQSAISAAS